MRIIPIKSIFLSESQSTSQVRPVSLLCFTGGETEVGIGWGTGLCIWQHVGQARGQTQRVSHALLPPHPDHYSKTCPLSASSRYMLVSSHSVPLGEELCNSPQVAHLPHRKELIAKLSLWRRESHHSVLNKEDVKSQWSLGAFGRTGWCFSELERLFVMAAYVPRKYSLLPLSLGGNESDSLSFHVA